MIKLFLYLVSFSLTFLWGCASKQSLILKEPQPGKSLLVGAILVENDGIEEIYEAHTAKIDVVIVGKHLENGEEKKTGYRTQTDENGYFFLQNVPPGAYVLKGIEVDLAFSTRMIITSRWEGNTQIFYPISTMIDNNVRSWPPENESRVIDLGIHYFKIDASSRIFDSKFDSLENRKLALNKSHNMPAPLRYFKEKHPDRGWFK